MENARGPAAAPLPATLGLLLDCALMARTLVQRFVGDVRLVVRRATRPVTEEFDEHVLEAVAMAGVTRAVMVVLVGDGAEVHFDSEQRAKLCKAGLFSTPHALMAPPIRPEVVLSMRWLGAEIRPFQPDGFEDACTFLEIDASRRPELHDVLVAAKRILDAAAPRSALTSAYR